MKRRTASARSGIRRASNWFVVVAAMSATACHTYTPVETPTPGSTVRVRIPIRSVLDDPNAPTRTTSIEGLLVEAGDTIVLATQSRREYGAYREILQFDTIRLGPDQRETVELRTFSNGRSIVLGVVLTGVVGFAALNAFGGESGEGGGTIDPPPPPPAIVSRSMISSIVGFLLGR